MLKINNLPRHKISVSLLSVVCCSLALFTCLTFVPAQTFAADSVVDPNEHRTLSGISSMQDMSQQICMNSAEGETKQLVDARDSKAYWVTKLADGNCWMTQNLDYDIKVGDFTGAVATRTGNINSGWSSTQTQIQSWDPGNYYYVMDTSWTNCGNGQANFGSCSKWTTSAPASEGAHYHVGNYYSWNAATAGTGASITSGEASASICPTGWKLPTSNNTAKDSFGYLMGQYGLRTDNGSEANVNKVRLTPLYFIPAGFVNTDGLNGAGNYGLYWSSSPMSDGTQAYGLGFASGDLNPSYNDNRYYGRFVRCLATGGWLNDESTANLAITVSPVISIDATSGMNEEVDFTTVANGNISATISSNQAYQVLLSTNQSTLEQSPVVANQNIPMVTADTALAPGTRAWGIKKTLSATTGNPGDDSTSSNTLYSAIGIGDNKVLFYKSANAESKTLTFPVAITVDPTLPSGTYSTQVIITAVGN